MGSVKVTPTPSKGGGGLREELIPGSTSRTVLKKGLRVINISAPGLASATGTRSHG